jgi:hypothetical protein
MTIKHIAHTFILIMLLAVVFIACSRKLNPEIVDTPHRDPTKDYIAFFNYLLQSADSTIEANFVNTILAEGKIKLKNQQLNTQDGKLLFETLDKNGAIVSSNYFPNPLVKNIEYVNDQGNLDRKIIFQPEAEFTVRMQLPYEAKTIVLSLEMVNNKKKELNRQEI